MSMTHISTHQQHAADSAALRGSALGTYVGLVIGLLVFTVAASVTPVLATFLGSISGGAIAGLIYAKHLKQTASQRLRWASITAGGWMMIAILLTSILGFLSAIEPSAGLSQAWPGLIISGTCLSVAQWWWLRRRCRGGGWWVLISCGTWAVVPLIYPVLLFPAALISDWM